MFDKFAVSCFTNYYKAKAKFKKMTSGEEGMETLETIIIVAIAVVVAGFIINFLTKGQFGDSNQGIVGYMFQKIGNVLGEIFPSGDNYDVSGANPFEGSTP